MEYKNELQVIDTKEKAYFLGLMYADGNISKENACRISLADRQLIDDLYILFSFFNKGEFDFGKYGRGEKKQYSLAKCSKKLQNDLISNGLVFNKSGINCENVQFPSLDKTLISHFIRGYFDGDGSIYINKDRPNLRRVEICSSSKKFLIQISNKLVELGINEPILREILPTNTNKRKIPLYVLFWQKSEDILKIKEYLYKEDTISLKRKKEKFKSFVIIPKTINNPICSCGNVTHFKGDRVMKTRTMKRYKCFTCKKSFSIQAPVKSDELLEKPEEVNQQPSLELNAL